MGQSCSWGRAAGIWVLLHYTGKALFCIFVQTLLVLALRLLPREKPSTKAPAQLPALFSFQAPARDAWKKNNSESAIPQAQSVMSSCCSPWPCCYEQGAYGDDLLGFRWPGSATALMSSPGNICMLNTFAFLQVLQRAGLRFPFHCQNIDI